MVTVTPEQLVGLMEKYKVKQQSLPQEQHDENKEKFQALLGNATKMEEKKAKENTAFQAADADGDGKLSLAEYIDFNRRLAENATVDGWHLAEYTDTEHQEYWTELTGIAGTPDGISQKDMDSIRGQVRAALAAKPAH
mmetsp:Transcript_31564/g.62019  ORF Transcript_31564/g.62019 Transcript_31564/m.62019 type:complete len:138 (+) Transcript_31564:37-450(+)